MTSNMQLLQLNQHLADFKGSIINVSNTHKTISGFNSFISFPIENAHQMLVFNV